MDLATHVLGGRYELGRVLGHGGMSEVRAARDLRLGREVAVKLFDPARWSRPDGRARFEAEARAAAAVSHPNVVAVYDVGVEGGVPFLVVECMPGASLAEELRRGPLPAARVVRLAREVLAGLDAAHARGVLHRDVKPANVLFTADGRAKIGDFGIAVAGDAELTEPGVVLGTPSYLAPERVAGRPATVRSDVYAVGVVCYEALSGVRPFVADTPLGLAHAIHEGRPRPLRDVRPDLPRALADTVMRAMARDPDARFASAGAMAAALGGVPDADDAQERTLAVGIAPVPPTTRIPVARPAPVPAPRPAPRGRPRRARGLAVALGLAAAGALAFGVAASRDPEPAPRDEPVVDDAVPPLPEPLREPFERLEDAVAP